MKIENILLGENRLEFKQTSKGIWYCDGFSLYCTSIMDAIALSSKVIEEIDKLLKEKNKHIKLQS